MDRRPARRPSAGDFTRTYGCVCAFAAVLGVAATIWALTWDVVTAVVVAVLTVLLPPTYLLVRWRVARGFRS